LTASGLVLKGGVKWATVPPPLHAKQKTRQLSTNILVIAPHPDDESIGCGGAICLHSARGERVAAVFITSGEKGLKNLDHKKAQKIREAEAKKAAKILGIGKLYFLRLPDWTSGKNKKRGVRLLLPVLKRERPSLIYLPHPGEWHPDHQAALPMLRAALKRAAIPKPKLLAYEIWTPLLRFDHVENIVRVMRRKLKALAAHKSQLKEFNYERAIIGLNQYRGELAAKCRFAEVFSALSPVP